MSSNTHAPEPEEPGSDSHMRLPDFILANTEPILSDWEAFARGVWPAPASTDPVELRDHAEAILRATAADMKSNQTAAQQAAKSKGHAAGGPSTRRLNTASEQHGAGRVDSGFKIAEVLAEYRALRASVVRLWRETRPDPDPHDLDDLTRFHESMDQSLAQAVGSFTDRIDQARRLFLAILGHDLRNPLAAITMLADVQTRRAGSEAETRRASQIAASARAMNDMIRDLLDFAAAGLGGDMPLSVVAADLQPICRDVIEEVQTAHPRCAIRYEPEGDLTGTWDRGRLRQVVSNLIGNAVQHGDDRGDIDVRVRGEEAGVVLTVHNDGPPIPPAVLSALFDPLRRLASPADDAPGSAPADGGGSPAGEGLVSETSANHASGGGGGRVGLGLYIAHQIVMAHGGTIEATSTAEGGTTFTVRLPRFAPKRQAAPAAAGV